MEKTWYLVKYSKGVNIPSLSVRGIGDIKGRENVEFSSTIPGAGIVANILKRSERVIAVLCCVPIDGKCWRCPLRATRRCGEPQVHAQVDQSRPIRVILNNKALDVYEFQFTVVDVRATVSYRNFDNLRLEVVARSYACFVASSQKKRWRNKSKKLSIRDNVRRSY